MELMGGIRNRFDRRSDQIREEDQILKGSEFRSFYIGNISNSMIFGSGGIRVGIPIWDSKKRRIWGLGRGILMGIPIGDRILKMGILKKKILGKKIRLKFY